MPVRQIWLGTATVSVGLATPAASMPAQERFVVSATVVSPCSISVRDAALSAEIKAVSVDCALPGQSFVRENDRTTPPIKFPTPKHRPREVAGADGAEVIEIVF